MFKLWFGELLAISKIGIDWQGDMANVEYAYHFWMFTKFPTVCQQLQWDTM